MRLGTSAARLQCWALLGVAPGAGCRRRYWSQAAARRAPQPARRSVQRRCFAAPSIDSVALEPPSQPVNAEQAARQLVRVRWGADHFDQGADSNAQKLRRIRDDFDSLLRSGCGQDEVVCAALEFAGVLTKLYKLDEADRVVSRVMPWCRAAGGPFVWKALQKAATLRFKQQRFAQCVSLLEELADVAPPSPATFSNLATAHAALEEYQEARACVERTVQLRGGVQDKDDTWTLGNIERQTNPTGAIAKLEKALSGHQRDCPDDAVLIAKVRESLAEAYLAADRPENAESEFHSVAAEFRRAQGPDSPLTGAAVFKLSRAQTANGRYADARDSALQALRVLAPAEDAHPEPLCRLLEHILDLHAQKLSEGAALVDAHDDVRALIANLERRRMLEDGDGAVVLHKVGEVLLFSGPDYAGEAGQYLERADKLIRAQGDVPGLKDLLDVIELELEVVRQAAQSALGDGARQREPEVVGYTPPAQPTPAPPTPAPPTPAPPAAEPVRVASSAPVREPAAGGGELQRLEDEMSALFAENARLRAENEQLRARCEAVAGAWTALSTAATSLASV